MGERNVRLPSPDFGLLVLRLGVGTMFMVHGYPKIIAPEKWPKLGGAMATFGLDVFPAFWGFMAAFAEFGGGLAFALGLLFMPASALLAFTMVVAALFHLDRGDGVSGASHAIEAASLFAGMMLVGPGRYTLDRVLRRNR